MENTHFHSTRLGKIFVCHLKSGTLGLIGFFRPNKSTKWPYLDAKKSKQNGPQKNVSMLLGICGIVEHFLLQCLQVNWKIQKHNLLCSVCYFQLWHMQKYTLFYSPSPPDTTNYIVAEIKMKFFFLQCSTSKVWKAFKIPQSFKSADFAKSCKYIQWISS